MARRKSAWPTRHKRPYKEVAGQTGEDEVQIHHPIKRPWKPPSTETDSAVWRNLLLPEIRSEDGKEVAHINLVSATSVSGFAALTPTERENFCKDGCLRVRVQLPMAAGRTKCFALQEVSRQDLRVHILAYPAKPTTSGGDYDVSNSLVTPVSEVDQDSEYFKVMASGEVDGPDSAVTALAYLICQGYTSLRSAPCLTCGASCCWDHDNSGRLSVLISKKAFMSFESYGQRPVWRRAMQTVISWLRPELVSEMRIRGLRLSFHYDEEITENFEQLASGSGKQHVFDSSALYDGIKSSCTEPGLDMSFPDLLPNLRPYQRRAAYWMVQRERGFGARVGSNPKTCKLSISDITDDQCRSTSVASSTASCFSEECPLWFSVLPLDGSSKFFFNPYTGAVSLEPHDFVTYVKGGILADEMGLGKTIELLACILANPYKDSSEPSAADTARKLLHTTIASRKCERVECACGVLDDTEKYTASWLQCNVCHAWQHATCVGYALTAPRLKGPGNKAFTSHSIMLSSDSEPDQGSGEHLDSVKEMKHKKGSRVQNPSTGSYRSKGLLKENQYICGSCAELIGSVEVNGVCRATLVVCPTPILQQWQDEILRHTRVGSLRVIVYEGVERGAVIVTAGNGVAAEDSKRLKIVSAHDLAEADIVLTTYDTLKSDLCRDSDKTKSNQRTLRYIKRYPVVPTPLTRLCWWRVCLDEAQMVENNTAMATEMALLLDAQNRWCVTGTPIQHGLDDLFGLLRFLQAEPFTVYKNWNQALRLPYEAGNAQVMSYMHKFLGLLMWRSSKVQVKDELMLPPQEESISWLHFSPVEAHFYRQQHEKCAVKARDVIAKCGRQHQQSTSSIPEGQTMSALYTRHNDVGTTDQGDSVGQRKGNPIEEVGSIGLEHGSRMSDNSVLLNDVTGIDRLSNADEDRPLSPSEASTLSSSLLRLRQACCHPQVGSAGIRSLQQRSPMTMDEILQMLVDKAKTEAEEAQRALIGALNGLAALAAIDSDIPLAVSIYREVLALTEENAADFDVDPLQKLHTLHNLAELLGISSTPPVDREETVSDGVPDVHPGLKGAVSGSLTTTSQMKGTDIDHSEPGRISETSSVLERVTEGPGTAFNSMDGMPGTNTFTNVWAGDANSRTATSLGGTDKPQSIASVHLLGSKIPRTLRDDVLVKQCQEIRSKYLASFYVKLTNAQAEYESANLQVSEAKKDCEANGGTTWWLEVLKILESSDDGEDLVHKIRYLLLETDNFGKRGRHQNASSLALLFQEMSGLKYVVQTRLDALDSARDQVLECLNHLIQAMKNPTAQDIERILNCPRDSETMTGTLCAHCEMDDIYQIYENRLLLLRTSAPAGEVVSAEDAAIAQHRILAHRRITGSKDPQAAAGRNQSIEVDNDLVRNRRGATGAGATETEVLRAPSETEQILSIIKSHARVVAGGHNAAATKHLHIFEVMKREYSHMRALTNIQRDMLYALDELNMAVTRLSLLFPGEEVENEIEKLVKLPAEEVPQRNVQLTCEKFDALKDFQRAKGQLRYLKGLSLARRQQDGSRVSRSKTNSRGASHQESTPSIEGWSQIDDEACPVCQDKLGSQLMVLPCGHLLCCKCCMAIIEQSPVPPGGASQKRIACPACRQHTYVGDVAFVDNGSDRNVIAAQMGQLPKGARADEEASMEVKGSYGTKIEAVVRRLLWLKSKNPDTKVLVFSTWHGVLDVIEHALSTNMITFARVKGTKLNVPIQKFQGRTLQTSKSLKKRGQPSDTNEHVQVLLLPIERAGNGLNLVEAQHVILVEPSPNPALEAQAINRVHRIGQTQPTCVHRFIVTDTVEEGVYWLGRKKAELLRKSPGSGISRKKVGHYSFTLNDVNALFGSKTHAITDRNATSSTDLHHSSTFRLAPAAARAQA